MPTKHMSGLPTIFTTKQSSFPRELLATVEDPIDNILIPPGQKRIYTHHEILTSFSNLSDPTYIPPHATTFLFNREDHTLGNLLVTQLRKNPAVEYVAYKVGHPMHYSFELRVHITPGSMAAEGKRRLEAKDAVVEACKELVADLGMLGKRITQEWYIYKAMREGGLDGGDNTSALEGVVDYYPYHGTNGGFGGLSIPPRRGYRSASARNNKRNDNSDDGFDTDNDGYNHSNSHNSGDDLDHDRGSINDNNHSNSEPLYRASVGSMSPDYRGDMDISDSNNGGYAP